MILSDILYMVVLVVGIALSLPFIILLVDKGYGRYLDWVFDTFD